LKPKDVVFSPTGRDARQGRDELTDSSRKAGLAPPLVAGVLLTLLCAAVFAVLAGQVQSGAPITRLDGELAKWFHAHATHGLTLFMLTVTWLHSAWGILSMTAVLGGWLFRERLHDWLVALIVTVPGGMLINVAFKHLFHRARPHFDDPLLTLATYSFPSGHTASATVFYGFVVLLAASRVRPGWRVAAATVGAVVAVCLVALSRMYLGVHYLSDVLAAAGEGGMWLAACSTAFWLWRRREERA
jgi:membrane-associated phospholipid phosphatase